MYHFANIIPCKDGYDGFEPDLPSYVLSFSSTGPKHPECSWRLCNSTIDPNVDFENIHLEEIAQSLELLLKSAQGYPPAIALAFHSVNAKWPISKDEYQDLLISTLKFYLNEQKVSDYLLCEVLTDELGYTSKGDFVWAIKYNHSTKMITWVSDDYYLYQSPVHYFEINENMANRLREIA